MYNFFRKYWWAFALAALVFIFVVLPKVDMGLFAAYPHKGDEIITNSVYCDKFEGVCLEASVSWQKNIEGKLKGSTMIYNCALRDIDSNCKCDTMDPQKLLAEGKSCTKSIWEVDVSGSPSAPKFEAESTPKTVTESKTLCIDGKLMKGSTLVDDCEAKGCWTKNEIGVCKTGSGIGDFFSKEAIKGVPNYLLVLAGVFILFMFSMAGGKQ